VRTASVGYLVDLHGLGVRGYASTPSSTSIRLICGHRQATAREDRQRQLRWQEVIDHGGEAVKPSGTMSSAMWDDFGLRRAVAEQFRNANGQRLANLRTFGESWGLAARGWAVVFIDNHDMQRDRLAAAYLTYKDNNHALPYTLANVFMMAWAVRPIRSSMSSYTFPDFKPGPPSDDKGHTNSIYPEPKATRRHASRNGSASTAGARSAIWWLPQRHRVRRAGDSTVG